MFQKFNLVTELSGSIKKGRSLKRYYLWNVKLSLTITHVICVWYYPKLEKLPRKNLLNSLRESHYHTNVGISCYQYGNFILPILKFHPTNMEISKKYRFRFLCYSMSYTFKYIPEKKIPSNIDYERNFKTF